MMRVSVEYVEHRGSFVRALRTRRMPSTRSTTTAAPRSIRSGRFGLPAPHGRTRASGGLEIGQRRAALADQTLHARDRLAPLGRNAAPSTKTKKITVVTTMVPITE